LEAFRTDIVAEKKYWLTVSCLARVEVNKILAMWVEFLNEFFPKSDGKVLIEEQSSEQRARFANVYQDTLLKTYGRSLLELDGGSN